MTAAEANFCTMWLWSQWEQNTSVVTSVPKWFMEKKKEKKEITDFSVEQNGFSHRLKTEILKIPTNKQNYSCRLLYTLKLTSR